MNNTNAPELIRAAQHLKKAAEQLRRFNAFGFAPFSEPAALGVEKLAEALRTRKSGEEES